jgi:hypothetical protein
MKIIQIQRQKRTGLIKISLIEREFVNQNPFNYDLLGVINNDNIESLYFDLEKFRVCETFYFLSDMQITNLLNNMFI